MKAGANRIIRARAKKQSATLNTHAQSPANAVDDGKREFALGDVLAKALVYRVLWRRFEGEKWDVKTPHAALQPIE
jgi:hypothetical protein